MPIFVHQMERGPRTAARISSEKTRQIVKKEQTSDNPKDTDPEWVDEGAADTSTKPRNTKPRSKPKYTVQGRRRDVFCGRKQYTKGKLSIADLALSSSGTRIVSRRCKNNPFAIALKMAYHELHGQGIIKGFVPLRKEYEDCKSLEEQRLYQGVCRHRAALLKNSRRLFKRDNTLTYGH